jgi:hypothetical protein
MAKCVNKGYEFFAEQKILKKTKINSLLFTSINAKRACNYAEHKIHNNA